MAALLLSRKRLLITIALLVALGVALFAPLQREYTSSYDHQSGAATQLTTAHYGVPFTWLTLSKEEDAHNHAKVYSSTKTQEISKLAYDAGIWVAVLAIMGVIAHSSDNNGRFIREVYGGKR